MPLLQPFQNVGRFKVVATFEPIGWFYMEFCMEVMALNIVYCKLM
jgi:hypothetical protein